MEEAGTSQNRVVSMANERLGYTVWGIINRKEESEALSPLYFRLRKCRNLLGGEGNVSRFI